MVRKTAYVASQQIDGWPQPQEIEHFFLAPQGQEWTYAGGNDGWTLTIEGLHGTANAKRIDQVNVTLYVMGYPGLGVFLLYSKWDGRVGRKQSLNSKGNLDRLGEFVVSLHGDSMSVGLFVPFSVAWKAVKEFIVAGGELPTSIEWIATADLPPGTFPIPKRPEI